MAEESYKDPDTGQEEESTEIPIEDVSEEEKGGSQPLKEDGKDPEKENVTESAEASSEENGAGQEGQSPETSERQQETSGGSTGDASDTGAGEADKKSGFFSRNKKADKEKAQMKEKIDSLEDRVRRQMAEFDNYRKRTEREKEESFSMGERNVIEKMLPIVDNFERGFETVEESDKDDAFVTGMQKIYTQLMKQLTDLGVKPIECVGKPFDPDYHNAVMQVDSDEYESGTVAQELQKGYLYHDQVIRHSMVAVVK